MEAFAGNTNLKILTFEAPSFLSLQALGLVSQLESIEELYFNDGAISIAQLEQLSGMPKLRKLRYDVEDSESGNERLISILKTFPNLK